MEPSWRPLGPSWRLPAAVLAVWREAKREQIGKQEEGAEGERGISIGIGIDIGEGIDIGTGIDIGIGSRYRYRYGYR